MTIALLSRILNTIMSKYASTKNSGGNCIQDDGIDCESTMQNEHEEISIDRQRRLNESHDIIETLKEDRQLRELRMNHIRQITSLREEISSTSVELKLHQSPEIPVPASKTQAPAAVFTESEITALEGNQTGKHQFLLSN